MTIHVIGILLFIIFILNYIMDKDALFIRQRLFLYPFYFVLIFIVTIIQYKLLKHLNDSIYLGISFLIVFFSSIFIFLTFPSTASYELSEIPSIIYRLRNTHEDALPHDIFLEKRNDNFVKKIIMRKYNMNNIKYQITIDDSLDNFVTSYELVICNDKIYSNNPNLEYYLVGETFTMKDKLPNTSFNVKEENITYQLNKKNNNTGRIQDTKLYYNIYISKETIMFADFFLLDFVASLSAL